MKFTVHKYFTYPFDKLRGGKLIWLASILVLLFEYDLHNLIP
jgi:hypothetical protein